MLQVEQFKPASEDDRETVIGLGGHQACCIADGAR
jgi:hypothetical protein